MSDTLLDHLSDLLVTQGIARRPTDAPVGPDPLPPVWRHPQDGPVAPGDAAKEGKPQTARDDGLVITLMWGPGDPPVLGTEELRTDRIAVVFRSTAVSKITEADAAVRALLQTGDVGGRCDWVMAGRYVVQSQQWTGLQPLGAGGGVYTFQAEYRFVTRAT